MKKIFYILMSLVLITSVYAITISENTVFSPSGNNISYHLKQTIHTDSANVNETCIDFTGSFNRTYCTDIEASINPIDFNSVNYFEDITAQCNATNQNSMSFNYTWYVNGEKINNGNTLTLDNIYFSTNDKILFTCSLYDDYFYTSGTNTSKTTPYGLLDGLVSFYSFSKGYYDDFIGNYDITNQGTDITTGEIGKGIYFDHTENDYINTNIPMNRSMWSNGFTISFWINEDSSSEYKLGLFNEDSNSYFWSRYEVPGYGGYWEVFYNDTAYRVDIDLTTAGWHFLTITYNGNVLKQYHNGENIANHTFSKTITGLESLYFGSQTSGSLENFQGKMDEIGVWNRTLSQSEIKEMYINKTINPQKVTYKVKDLYTSDFYSNFTANILYIETGKSYTASTETDTLNYTFYNSNITNNVSVTSNLSDFLDIDAFYFNASDINYNFTTYGRNSISVYIYDEITEEIINTSTTDLTYNLDVNSYSESNDNGSFYLTNLESGEWEFIGENTNYNTRYFYVTLEENSHNELDLYLINKTESEKITHYILCESSPVGSALITYQASINGSYKTVAQRKTDGTGQAFLYLNTLRQYKVIIQDSGDNYINYFIPSESPIEIDICTGESGQPYNWSTVYNKFDYLLSPESSLVSNEMVTFSVSFSSEKGYLREFGIYSDSLGTMVTSNITGSPSGGEVDITLNLSNYTGLIDIYYYANITGENKLFTTKKTYKTELFSSARNFSVKENFEKMKPEFSEFWRYIIVTIIAFLVMIPFYNLIPPVVNSFIALAVFASFIYFGWIEILYIIPTGAVLIVYTLSERYI